MGVRGRFRRNYPFMGVYMLCALPVVLGVAFSFWGRSLIVSPLSAACLQKGGCMVFVCSVFLDWRWGVCFFFRWRGVPLVARLAHAYMFFLCLS